MLSLLLSAIYKRIVFVIVSHIILFQEIQNITVTWLGKKLGSSTGLFCDLKDGLHYFMTSEKASVRWDTKYPLDVNYST